MAERPIVFGESMVRALLREIEQPGTGKTMMRRILKGAVVFDDGEKTDVVWLHPYAVGDRLWVRESWQVPAPCDAQYRATSMERIGHWNPKRGPWRPSTHMPRWASRLTLIVSAVKVERLQDITIADAMAEGALESGLPYVGAMACDQARVAFSLLWDSIYGKLSWEINPWVVAVTFKPILGNIDREAARG